MKNNKIMKIHTIDREFCKCKHHSWRLNHNLKKMQKKFNKALDKM